MNHVEAVFGPEYADSTAEEAARRSRTKFVRGKRSLCVYDESRNPTGHILTAWEALHAYGLPVLEEAVEYSSAVLNAPVGMAPTIAKRLVALGLGSDLIPSHDEPTSSLEESAFVLGLDELRVGHKPIEIGDNDLAVRLRTLQHQHTSSSPKLSKSAVRSFAHAASVIRTQHKLQGWLGESSLCTTLDPDGYYGTPGHAYRIGYELAEKARKALSLEDRPIPSMRDLVEKILCIPVIQTILPDSIAGATVAVNSDHDEVRGIVLNIEGSNKNEWVRRATLAHELGHLLFDPIQSLNRVRVDTYQSSQADPEAPEADPVEQRANAFAIAFLAPVDKVKDMAPAPLQAQSLQTVQSHFGISITAARHHIRNAHYGQHEVPRVFTSAEPSDEQKSAEGFGTYYFPIRSTPSERVGRFAGIVVEAFDEGLISDDSAARYMKCSRDEFSANLGDLRDIYAS